MSFGVYIHIPYCVQRCIYCDFATYEQNQILKPEQYVNRVKKEISLKGQALGAKTIDTVYFGGGTPSLLDPSLLVSLLNDLDDAGFSRSKKCEITIEINPATLTTENLEFLTRNGFNRFSVGAQTFNDVHLKRLGRIHSAQQTRDTLDLLRVGGLNYSFDLLFGLPYQTANDLTSDLEHIQHYSPNHISPYCLTVPESNPLARNRPGDESQIKMFDAIKDTLLGSGYSQYEISNFSKPGRESQHNLLYWTDKEYLGFGLSAHSYLHSGEWGARFWNPSAINDYIQQMDSMTTWSISKNSEDNGENLEIHQALTDFCHTSFRLQTGLNLSRFEQKFSLNPKRLFGVTFAKLVDRGLLQETNKGFTLTQHGKILSNQVFREFTFLKGDIDKLPLGHHINS